MISNLIAKALAYYRAEPARVNSVIAAVVVAVLHEFGVVVDELSVVELLGVIVGLLGLGQATRSRVSPV